MTRTPGHYWVRAIPDGPWIIVAWYAAKDGDEGWIGKPIDWEPAEIGPLIDPPSVVTWDGVSDTYPSPAAGWTCFHCGETFHHQIPARRHFGADPAAEPACRIKGREENGLVIALRAAEADLARYQAEDTDLHRQIARMSSEHAIALRREEEAGYARGLRDEQERALRIVDRIWTGLTDGGARNACKEISREITDYADG